LLFVFVLQAIFSGMRIWTPALSAHILSTYGYWSIGAVSGGAAGIMFLLLAVSRVRARPRGVDRHAACCLMPPPLLRAGCPNHLQTRIARCDAAPAPPAEKPHAE